MNPVGDLLLLYYMSCLVVSGQLHFDFVPFPESTKLLGVCAWGKGLYTRYIVFLCSPGQSEMKIMKFTYCCLRYT